MVKPSLLIVLQLNIIDNMSIIGSPFDLSAEIFSQKYAAQGQQGGQATNDFQTTGSYATACEALKAFRNCEISTQELKTVVREINNDAGSWSGNSWEEFIANDCSDIPNNRSRDAVASDWGEWSDCAPNWLGKGKQHRQRTIVTKKRSYCVDTPFHGLTLQEFRDCELPDEEPIYGCMDSEANNYDVRITEDDGSCKYDEPIYGCMDSEANNYDSEATEDDGSCKYDEPIYGCMDSEANNYDSEVTEDDGSCKYDEPKGDDDDSEESSGITKTLTDNWMLVGAAILGLVLIG